MTGRRSRRGGGVAVAVLAVVAGTAVATAPVAGAAPAAAPVFQGSGFSPIRGDVTGDGVADRVALGTLSRGTASVCAYELRRGLGQGRFAAPAAAALPVRNTVPEDGVASCPLLGTVLAGPTPAQNRLAVTWNDLGPYDAPNVQLFRGLGTGAVRWAGGFDGYHQASSIRSVDLDGDGWGDVYEYTDQGAPFGFWVGRGQRWHPLDVYPAATFTSQVQLLDLDRRGGVDIISTYSDGGASDAGVVVADGRSGAVQTLVRTSPSDVETTTLAASVVDLDHDALPDIRVDTTTDDGAAETTTSRYFRNESRGGRWYFRELPT